MRGWKKTFHANENQKQYSDKIDFKIKNVRDKEGYCIMIKGLIQEENIAIVNIYAPNIGKLVYRSQMLTAIKREINSNTIIVQFSHSVVSDSLRPHESQHARPPCPSPTPGVYSNLCPSSQWPSRDGQR